MAKVKLEKVGVAIGAGAVDEGLEYWDEQSGRTESFRNAKDIGRLALTAGGLLMTIFDFVPSIGESLYNAEIPLLVKSIAKPVREALKTEAATQVRRGKVLVPQRRAAANPSIGRSYQPEFEQAGAF